MSRLITEFEHHAARLPQGVQSVRHVIALAMNILKRSKIFTFETKARISCRTASKNKIFSRKQANVACAKHRVPSVCHSGPDVVEEQTLAIAGMKAR